jgi:hypothetical protein
VTHINSDDFKNIVAETFEVLVDGKRPMVAIKVNPRKGQPFIMPMKLEAAKNVSEHLLASVLAMAPELFTAPIYPPHP